MIFGKKKRMIDLRELHRGGVVRIPRSDVHVPTNKDGFVELGIGGSKSASQNSVKTDSTANVEFFGFGNTTQLETPSNSEFSTESDGYNKREVDEKITNLDNKIYKLENRIELLEKKLDVNKPTDENLGVMGW